MARSTFWIDNLIGLTVSSGSQNSVSLMTGTPPIDARRATITRIVVDLGIFSTTVAGAFGVNLIDFGFGVTSQEAFNAGIFADPNADERSTRGWMYRNRCVVWQNGVGTQIVTGCHADLRTGRKLYDGEPFLVANNLAIVGTTASYQIAGIVRMLLILP